MFIFAMLLLVKRKFYLVICYNDIHNKSYTLYVDEECLRLALQVNNRYFWKESRTHHIFKILESQLSIDYPVQVSFVNPKMIFFLVSNFLLFCFCFEAMSYSHLALS